MFKEKQLEKKLLLFVEGDPGWRTILKFIVKQLDVEAIYTESATSALRILRERNDVTCMFLDVPSDTDHIETDLAESFKSGSCYQGIPIIAMTAFEKSQIENFEGMGFSGYLQKPYSTKELGNVIDIPSAK